MDLLSALSTLCTVPLTSKGSHKDKTFRGLSQDQESDLGSPFFHNINNTIRHNIQLNEDYRVLLAMTQN